MNLGAKRPMSCLEPPMRRQGIIGEHRASTLSLRALSRWRAVGFAPFFDFCTLINWPAL
jgi:hypothetical protein